jgi:hypothetical protein
MENKKNRIKLELDNDYYCYSQKSLGYDYQLHFKDTVRHIYCAFNPEDEFILYCKSDRVNQEDKQQKEDEQRISVLLKNIKNRNIGTYVRHDGHIWIYEKVKEDEDDKDKVDKEWKCKSIQIIPEEFELISISNYSKLYLLGDNSVYEWDINGKNCTGRILPNEKIKEKKVIRYKIICLNFSKSIVINYCFNNLID